MTRAAARMCLILLAAWFSGCSADKQPVFSIRTANLDGSGVRTIYTDADRQATHLRVSPDGRWIMFSRYNERDPDDGLAKENWGGDNHYENTELMLMRSDGTELRSVVGPKAGVMAVNSNWTEDGRGFVFVSSDNPKKLPEIRRAYLNDKMEVARFETIALPEQLVPVDPHLHRGMLVFPAVDLKDLSRGLWISNEDGSNPRRLTNPKNPVTGEILKHPASGDNDPRISPDGRKVAFMRLIEGVALWNTYVVDIATGAEQNISSKHISAREMDAVPEWSGDGARLIFWSVNLDEVTFNVVTTRPDGSDRRVILPARDIFQQSPAFFPNSGSGPGAKIAFSTQTVPGWKLSLARMLGGV